MVKRRSKKRSSRRGGMTQQTKEILGAVGYAVIGEPLLDKAASSFGLGLSDDIVKGVLGFFISRNTKGVIKAMGDSAVNIAAYKVGGAQIGNLLDKFNITPTNNAVSNSGATF